VCVLAQSDVAHWHLSASTDGPADSFRRQNPPIFIRLGREQIDAVKKIVAPKSIGYRTQLRMWIAKGIKREAKAGPAPSARSVRG